MRTIWKYELDKSTLEMDKMIPAKSVLLDVQIQNILYAHGLLLTHTMAWLIAN